MNQSRTPVRDALAEVSGRIAALALVSGPDERGPWLFAHAWLADSRFESQGRDPARLEEACADLALLPGDFPSRAKLAAVLVDGHLRAGRLSDPDWSARMGRLAEVAGADPRPAPWWPRLAAAVHAHALLVASRAGNPGFRPLAALRELEEYEQVIGDDERYADLIALVRLGLQQAAADQSVGSEGVVEVAVELAATLQTLGGGAAADGRDRELRALAAFIERIQGSDPEGAVAFLDQAAEVARSLLAEDSDSFSPATAYEAIRRLMDLPGGESLAGDVFDDASDDGLGDDLGDLTDLGGRCAAERASALHDKAMGHLDGGTLPALVLATDYARQSLATAAQDDPHRPLYLLTTAVIHLRRAETTGDLDGTGVAAAVQGAELARTAAGSVAHPLWARISTVLALAYRHSGRAMESRLVALDGLYGRAYDIQRRTDPDEIQAAADEGAADALTVARWCLADDDPDGAAIAAEVNRGLILYAAADNRDDAAWLLDPPTMQDMQSALSSHGMDALVYLIPGDDVDGSAVIVRPGAALDWISLAQLSSERLAGLAQAAIEPLLEVLGGTREETDLTAETDRGPFRVVLIPLAEPSSLPWPAEQHSPDGSLVFSYAASARMYCQDTTDADSPGDA